MTTVKQMKIFDLYSKFVNDLSSLEVDPETISTLADVFTPILEEPEFVLNPFKS
jgi:hypothetical protein